MEQLHIKIRGRDRWGQHASLSHQRCLGLGQKVGDVRRDGETGVQGTLASEMMKRTGKFYKGTVHDNIPSKVRHLQENYDLKTRSAQFHTIKPFESLARMSFPPSNYLNNNWNSKDFFLPQQQLGTIQEVPAVCYHKLMIRNYKCLELNLYFYKLCKP